MKSLQPIRFGRTWTELDHPEGFPRSRCWLLWHRIDSRGTGQRFKDSSKVTAMFSISGVPAASLLARVPIIQTSVLTSAAAGEQSHYLLNNLVRVIISWKGECETAVTCCLGESTVPVPSFCLTQ